MNQPKCVIRSIALPIPTFDYLKQFQRELERERQTKLTNSQALAILLAEHQQFTQKEDADA